jgi:phosphoribosylformylglycinamidine (FGAM) synthase-like enzyme
MGAAVLPTPLIGMLGLLENVEKRAGMAFKEGYRLGLLWRQQEGDEPFAGGVGAEVSLDALESPHPNLRSDVLLFNEEASRIIVCIPTEKWSQLEDLARVHGISLLPIGTAGGDALRISRGADTLIDLPMDRVEEGWRNQM